MHVLHATPDYIVIDKPSGLLSVPGIGPDKQDCAISRAKALFPHAQGPMMVHRLDMDTSGLMLIALTREAQVFLSREFELRNVEKSYVALCDGIVARDEGTINLPLRLDADRRPYRIVDVLQGKPAFTRFRVLAREVDRTRVHFDPQTGRTHQLRIHAATPEIIAGPSGSRVPGGLGAPIMGDVLYGEPCNADRLMLHARALRFREPGSLNFVEFVAPVPF